MPPHPGYLLSLRRRPGFVPDDSRFPWSVPLIRGLDSLSFETPVTFLVGENGSGKSTVLEGIAAGMDAAAVGSREIGDDPTLQAARDFADGYMFSRRFRAPTRVFMRAEDAFGFTGRITALMRDLGREADEAEAAGSEKAASFLRGDRIAFARTYGANPDGQSHGETFLKLLDRRLRPPGLFFLDEPETPLSPSRVLALIAMLTDLVAMGSQFVIATHSPILLAMPGATILQAEGASLRRAEWNDLEHVRVTRAFLNDPARVLHRLLGEGGPESG